MDTDASNLPGAKQSPVTVNQFGNFGTAAKNSRASL